jgi:hypothetical protein
MANTRNRGAN